MAPLKALIVLINGIECYRDFSGPSNESEAVNRKTAILERFPDSEVMELNVFPDPELRLKVPTDDWISQSAVQALADLEAASRDSACGPIVFIANNIGVALAKQILLLAFDSGNTPVLAHRTLAMFFAGYPDFNETIYRSHHEGLTLQLLLEHRQKLFSDTFTKLLNTLPRILYVVDSDFAAIETKYCPKYLPDLPLSLEGLFPELEEAFFAIDDVIGRKQTQLLPTYESFFKCGTKIASELRRPAPLREHIDPMSWLLDHSTFRQWLKGGSSPILFISGPPGSGKTIMSWSIPSLLDTENRKRASDQRELYLVFDFSRCDTRLDTEKNFVTSLICQCLALRPQLFNNAAATCQSVLDLRAGSVCTDQLWPLLRQLLSASDDHRVFLIVVAIDQAQRADTSELDIFKKLLKLANDRIISGRLRILVTGPAAIKMESHRPLHIDLAGSEESRAAIQRALFEKVLKIVSMRPVWSDHVEEITKNPCFSNSNYFDTMLRAALLESTKIPSTKASLTENLKSMESIGSTDRVYQLLLSNLENFDMAKEALNWVFHATRPLTVSELSVAIALSSICKSGEASEPEPPAGEDAMTLLEDNISWDLRRDLQGIIGKAIKLVGSVGNVCLIHHTFRQYFENCKDLFVPGFHSLITQRCLAYISRVAKQVDGSSGNIRNPSRALALLSYADLAWTEHYKLSVHPDSLLDRTATTFLQGEEGAAWFERLEINAEKILDAVDGDPLVMAAERGLTDVVKGLKTASHLPLVVKGWNFEVALLAAIWRGDLDIFEIILPMVLPFSEPTFPRRCLKLASEYGRTDHAIAILSKIGEGVIDALFKAEDSPCLVAAKNGHMETLTALLDQLPQDAVLQTDSLSRTVIHWAAAWGDADALRKLYERKGVRAKMLSTDSKSSTLLHLAAAVGSVEAVEFLLEVAKELVEKKDDDDLTALHLAAKEGHEAVVNTLIKAPADVWARSRGYRGANCALELAAKAGHLPIFSLLLDEMKKILDGQKEQGDETKSDDESDDSHLRRSAKLREHFRTSLNVATCAGHGHIVRYILRQGGEYVPTIGQDFIWDNFFESQSFETIEVFVSEGVDLIREEGAGFVLLAGAVYGGRADVVRYIVNNLPEKPLKAENVSFDGGGNILHYAAGKGRRAVMRELLRHRLADSLLQDSDHSGDKPLDTAVMQGHDAVVKEILRAVEGRRQFRTIFRAVEAKRVSIVKLLLDSGWEADCRDGDANTPLHKATDSGATEIVELLLKKSNTSLLNKRNDAGDTPLHIAVSKKDRDIVKRLLDSGADPNVLNSTSGLSPLHLLCKSGGENAEEILREFARTEGGASKTEGKHREKTEFSLPASDGSTALHYAINLKDLGLIRILLEQRPNLGAEVTETRTTPLMAAIIEGIDIELTRLLLKPNEKSFLDKRDSENKSALDRAIDREEWPIVKELVETGAEVNPKDIGDNPTPLYAVISKKNLQMVEFFLSKGANPNLSGQKSLPPFELALFQESEDIAKALLESDKFDLKTTSARYSFGSHLHAALFMSQNEIFDILVTKGANTQGSAPPYGKPIHLAVSVNYSFDECRSFVEKLVHSGAEVNDKDPGGRTALSLSATEYPNSDITFLLDLGADPNMPDRLGATSLHYAAQASSNDNLKRLIEKGGDVRGKDECKRSVLYRAAMSGDHDKFMAVLRELPEDCRQGHLAAAIYPAVARRAADIVKTILEETTIDFSARDRNGWTVLEIAEAYGDEDLISTLRETAGELFEVKSRERIEPSAWNPDDKGPRIQLFGNGLGGSIQETIEALNKIGPTNLRANACMFPDPETGVFYFEVTVLQADFVSVGFCEEYAMLDKIVGLFEGSWGYHSDDGQAYWGDIWKGKRYGQTYGLEGSTGEKEDVIGCGVDFRNKVAFFTLNGKNQGDVFHNICGQLYPTVSLAPGTKESRVQVNFGKQPFRYNLKDRKADASD